MITLTALDIPLFSLGLDNSELLSVNMSESKRKHCLFLSCVTKVLHFKIKKGLSFLNPLLLVVGDTGFECDPFLVPLEEEHTNATGSVGFSYYFIAKEYN